MKILTIKRRNSRPAEVSIRSDNLLFLSIALAPFLTPAGSTTRMSSGKRWSQQSRSVLCHSRSVGQWWLRSRAGDCGACARARYREKRARLSGGSYGANPKRWR